MKTTKPYTSRGYVLAIRCHLAHGGTDRFFYDPGTGYGQCQGCLSMRSGAELRADQPSDRAEALKVERRTW